MTNYARKDIDHARQEKLQTYQGYLTATVLLKEALQNEDMAKVERLLVDREKLAGQVDRLDQMIEQAMNFHPRLSDRSHQVKNGDDMTEILRSIVAANADCDTLAAGKYAELKNDLLMIRQKEAGLHGYAAQPQRSPVFLNVKS